MAFDISSVWPKWEIVSLIKSGGYGQVFSARRVDNDATAAIKVVSIDTTYVDTIGKAEAQINEELFEIAQKMLQEIKIMQKLKGSNNIVSIEDSELIKRADGIGYDIYIRMELLTPLTKCFVKKHPTEEDIIKIGCDICTALEICHKENPKEGKKKIIHRDIKPDNILYHKVSDVYKLGDFGISKEMANTNNDFTRGTGTANYMAPEVAKWQNYDERADVYSLGLVLYVLSNENRLPFVPQAVKPGDREQAMKDRCDGKPLPPPCQASTDLTKVILKACAFSPSDRYDSAAQMKAALQGVIEKSATTKAARAVAPASPDQQPVGTFGPDKKKRKLGWSIALIFIIILAIGIWQVGTAWKGYGASNSFDDNRSDISSDIDNISQPDETVPEQQEMNGIATDENTDSNHEENVQSIGGDTKQTAIPVQTSQVYSAEGPVDDDWEHWYALTTSSNVSNYSIQVCGGDSAYYVNFEIIDGNDFKVVDGFSRGTEEVAVVYLEPDTTYWIRISADRHAPPYQFAITEMLCDGGLAREQALPIEINREYQKSIEVDGQADWFKFTTTANSSVYRFYVNTKINDNPVNGRTYLALYDADGIKIKEINIDYESEGFFDVYLASNTQYTVKIFAEHTVPAIGDYLLCISEKTCDAGIDKASAPELELGLRYTAKVDSTLSDWYLFTANETGEYIITVHNIDVGCTVDFSGDTNQRHLFSYWVKNEDSYSLKFRAEKGEEIYITISANSPIADGTYILLIEKQEAT